MDQAAKEDKGGEQQWRRNMEQSVNELKTSVSSLTSNVATALSIHASNLQQITDNTRITLDLKDSMQSFQERAMPAIEVTETMQRGATAIGKTVEFVSTWGRRFWHVLIFVGACWIMFKVVTSGGTWTEAIKAFFSFQQQH